MAIKINNTTTIADDRTSDFQYVNPGSYTKAQLEAKVITGIAGSFTFCSDLDKLVFWDAPKNEWGSIAGIDAIGGTITESNGYKYHDFTSPGTLTFNSGIGEEAFALVIGGGGSGAYNNVGDGGAAGGGGGGVVIAPFIINTPSYGVVIGGGGPNTPSPRGNDGGDSSFGSDLIARGGGGGLNYNSSPNTTSGGSTGGVYGSGVRSFTQTDDPSLPANSRTYGYGNVGGAGAASPGYGGGGGGGAHSVGQQGKPAGPGEGGHGKDLTAVYWLNGSALSGKYVAGGGGGNSRAGASPGGFGGGGAGGTNGTAGTDGIGGGGGAAVNGTKGKGGSGRVIIGYPIQ